MSGEIEVVKSEEVPEIVKPEEQPVEVDQLIAFDPSQLASAQSSLKEWCDRKIKELNEDKKEIESNLAIAKKNKWRTSGYSSMLSKLKQKVTFYSKIKDALAAGYLLIPNFPIDVFAIRRSGTFPTRVESSQKWGSWSQNSEILPTGKGHYVSDETTVGSGQRLNDKREVQKYYYAKEFKDVNFPFKLAHPSILKKTQQAMMLKVFDEVGAVGERRQKDPMLIGRIFDPTHAYQNRFVTFFIAWWFDYESL